MGRIGDRRLREAISEAVQAWKQIFASAPSPPGFTDDLQRKQKQIEKLSSGVDAINRALRRLDELELNSL